MEFLTKPGPFNSFQIWTVLDWIANYIEKKNTVHN
jgi:hypothetical protein